MGFFSRLASRILGWSGYAQLNFTSEQQVAHVKLLILVACIDGELDEKELAEFETSVSQIVSPSGGGADSATLEKIIHPAVEEAIELRTHSDRDRILAWIEEAGTALATEQNKKDTFAHMVILCSNSGLGEEEMTVLRLVADAFGVSKEEFVRLIDRAQDFAEDA